MPAHDPSPRLVARATGSRPGAPGAAHLASPHHENQHWSCRHETGPHAWQPAVRLLRRRHGPAPSGRVDGPCAAPRSQLVALSRCCSGGLVWREEALLLPALRQGLLSRLTEQRRAKDQRSRCGQCLFRPTSVELPYDASCSTEFRMQVHPVFENRIRTVERPSARDFCVPCGRIVYHSATTHSAPDVHESRCKPERPIIGTH